MTQPESRLSRKIMAGLQAEWPDLFVFKVWGSVHMMAGLPDLIGCIHGRFFGLEVKLPANRKGVSARQEYVAELIRKAGGITGVVCSSAEAISFLRESIPKKLR